MSQVFLLSNFEICPVCGGNHSILRKNSCRIQIKLHCFSCGERPIGDARGKLCLECRAKEPEQSYFDTGRYMRSFQSRTPHCRVCLNFLGPLGAYCLACESIQDGWAICESCSTFHSPLHLCLCGESAVLESQDLIFFSRRRLNPRLFELAIRKSDGTLLGADEDHDAWIQIRFGSIGASDARKLIKKNGERRTSFDQMVYSKTNQIEDDYFSSYSHGITRERHIARFIQQAHPKQAFLYNRFIYAGQDFRHVATPDMVGREHLCEIKTSTKPLKQALSIYYDQLQWQMHVTGYDSVLFVVEGTYDAKIYSELVSRDQLRIAALVESANELLEQLPD